MSSDFLILGDRHKITYKCQKQNSCVHTIDTASSLYYSFFQSSYNCVIEILGLFLLFPLSFLYSRLQCSQHLLYFSHTLILGSSLLSPSYIFHHLSSLPIMHLTLLFFPHILGLDRR